MRRFALLAAALLAGCARAPAPGPAPAGPTVVSLNPCSDAILAEVADPAQVLAISHYSHDPRATSMPLAQARRFRVTGGTVEEVVALDPDVVVASTFLSPAAARAFARLGIRVVQVGVAGTVAESEAQVRRLAALVGHPERGERLAKRIDAALAAGPARPPLTALIWQEGGIVPGPEALIWQLAAQAGFANLSAARGLGQGAYLPLEQVLADPPQVILAAGDERMLRHPALRHLAGTRRETLDPSLLYCGGPTIVRAAARLRQVRDRL